MSTPIPYEDIRNLPLPDLGLRLLRTLGDSPNFNNLIQGIRNAGGYGEPCPADLDALLERLSDAWSWLESHALIGPSSSNPQTGNWQRVTSQGAVLQKDPKAAPQSLGCRTARRRPRSGTDISKVQLCAR